MSDEKCPLCEVRHVSAGAACPHTDCPHKQADEIARLRAALVDHNDLLRSAFQAAQRDATHDTAGTTNFRLLADRLSETLDRHHAITAAARAAIPPAKQD